MGKKFSKSKGITLIALVVTIVVLLILAGVSIAMLAGEDGIIKQANNAKVESVHGQVAEAMVLEYGEYQIELKTTTKTDTFIEYLTDKQIINASEVVNVEKLTGKELALGNGTDNETDVYKMVTQGSYYKLNYYGKDKAELELEEFLITGQVGGSGGIEKVEPENIADWEYRVEDDNTITITMYKGTDTEVVIPNYINNKPVKKISATYRYDSEGDGWYGSLWGTDICDEVKLHYTVDIEQNTITKVIVSEGIEIIDSCVFNYSKALEEVILPSNLTTISRDAFSDCSSLSSIVIPESVENIASYSFYECTNLTTIYVKKETDSISGAPWGADNATVIWNYTEE